MNSTNRKYALVLVEGDTEVIFYGRLKELFHPKASSKVINLHGNWNINQKVLDLVSNHADTHPDTQFAVCICIDRESRKEKAPIDIETIKRELRCYENISQDDIKLYEAVQDIESWLFYDIEGIYKHLRTPKAARNKTNYLPVEKVNHRDLAKLFERNSCEYRKGYAAKNFIHSLDLDSIVNQSQTLKDFCLFLKNF